MSRGDLPDDALIAELMEHPSESMALEELAQRMRPIIMAEALKHREHCRKSYAKKRAQQLSAKQNRDS